MKASEFAKFFDFTIQLNVSNERNDEGGISKYIVVDDQECFCTRHIDNVIDLICCFDSMLMDYINTTLEDYGFDVDEYGADYPMGTSYYEIASDWIKLECEDLRGTDTEDVIDCMILQQRIEDDIDNCEVKTMVDFDKLNEMIDGVNKVLVDVDMETLANNEQVYFNKAIAYEIATEDLRKYCEILDKAVGNPENNHKIGDFKINLGFVELKFTTYKRCCRRSNFGLYINEDTHYDGYEIISRGKAVSYEAINHSFPGVIQFEKMCQEWDKHKVVVETAIVNRVNEMLKYRTEIAHENLDKSKEALRNTPRLDFD